jgi:hypothetical protein
MRKKIREVMEEHLDEMLHLLPTFEEVDAFVRSIGGNCHGIVVAGDGRRDYRLPFIHETWRKKWDGRTHIDFGNGEYHLMLDKFSAPQFIEFVKRYRGRIN